MTIGMVMFLMNQFLRWASSQLDVDDKNEDDNAAAADDDDDDENNGGEIWRNLSINSCLGPHTSLSHSKSLSFDITIWWCNHDDDDDGEDDDDDGEDDNDNDDEIDWPAQQCDLSGFCSPATGLRNTWQIYLKDLFEVLFQIWIYES